MRHPTVRLLYLKVAQVTAEGIAAGEEEALRLGVIAGSDESTEVAAQAAQSSESTERVVNKLEPLSPPTPTPVFAKFVDLSVGPDYLLIVHRCALGFALTSRGAITGAHLPPFVPPKNAQKRPRNAQKCRQQVQMCWEGGSDPAHRSPWRPDQTRSRSTASRRLCTPATCWASSTWRHISPG